MKFSIIIVLLLFLSINSNSQDVAINAIHLTNGAVYKGIITERIDNVKLRLQTLDGRILEIDYSVISRIEKEPAIGINRKYSKKEKAPGLAFLYSFLLPGGGQFYNGQNLKGALMLTGYLGGTVTTIALASSNNVTPEQIYIPMGGALLIWLYSIIDAPVNANKINDKALSFHLIKLKNHTIKLTPQLITLNNYTNNKVTPGFSLCLKLR